MGAHPNDTWCKKIGPDDSPAYVNWLEDERLLPAVVPHARIMRYGYESQWFGENAIKTKTSDISRQLLFDLKEFRKVSVPGVRCVELRPRAYNNYNRKKQTDRSFSLPTVMAVSLF